MGDFVDGCHDTDCDREEDWLIRVTQYSLVKGNESSLTYSPTKSTMKRCDEHFVEKLHGVARKERKEPQLVSIDGATRVVECPVETCTERPPDHKLDTHVELHHGKRTLTDRAYRRLQELKEAL